MLSTAEECKSFLASRQMGDDDISALRKETEQDRKGVWDDLKLNHLQIMKIEKHLFPHLFLENGSIPKETKEVNEGDQFSFIVSVKGGRTPYIIQWKHNSTVVQEVLVDEQRPVELKKDQMSLDDDGLHFVVVSDSKDRTLISNKFHICVNVTDESVNSCPWKYWYLLFRCSPYPVIETKKLHQEFHFLDIGIIFLPPQFKKGSGCCVVVDTSERCYYLWETDKISQVVEIILVMTMFKEGFQTDDIVTVSDTILQFMLDRIDIDTKGISRDQKKNLVVENYGNEKLRFHHFGETPTLNSLQSRISPLMVVHDVKQYKQGSIQDQMKQQQHSQTQLHTQTKSSITTTPTVLPVEGTNGKTTTTTKVALPTATTAIPTTPTTAIPTTPTTAIPTTPTTATPTTPTTAIPTTPTATIPTTATTAIPTATTAIPTTPTTAIPTTPTAIPTTPKTATTATIPTTTSIPVSASTATMGTKDLASYSRPQNPESLHDAIAHPTGANPKIEPSSNSVARAAVVEHADKCEPVASHQQGNANNVLFSINTLKNIGTNTMTNVAVSASIEIAVALHEEWQCYKERKKAKEYGELDVEPMDQKDSPLKRIAWHACVGSAKGAAIGSGTTAASHLAIAGRETFSTLGTAVENWNIVVAVGFFTFSAAQTFRQWLNIPKEQRKYDDLKKQLFFVTFGQVSGIFGGIGGRMVGMLLGQVGGVIGSIVGGILGSQLGHISALWVWEKRVDDPERKKLRKKLAGLLGLATDEDGKVAADVVHLRWYFLLPFIHPDKVAPEYREDVSKQFVILKEAKEVLLDQFPQSRSTTHYIKYSNNT